MNKLNLKFISIITLVSFHICTLALADCDAKLFANKTWLGTAENAPMNANYDSAKPLVQRSYTVADSRSSQLIANSNSIQFEVKEFISSNTSNTKDGESLTLTLFDGSFDIKNCILTLKPTLNFNSDNSHSTKQPERIIKILKLSADDSGGITTLEMNARFCLDSSCETGDELKFIGMR